MPETILVLAGNRAEFDEWYSKNKTKFISVVYGEDLGTIRKVSADTILEVGSYRSREDARELMSAAMEGLKPRR